MNLKLLIALIIIINITLGKNNTIPFDTTYWDLSNAEIIKHLGRKALAGSAALKDVEFRDGIIEVDIAVTGARSYPGIFFRAQDESNYERFYIRPHKSGLTNDALQYTPVFNKVAGWQLYHGNGYTGPAVFKENEWMHLRMEISGDQAKVFIDDMNNPVLIIDKLEHGNSSGGIGLIAPKNGMAYFSNFRFTKNENLKLALPEKTFAAENTISSWELSKPFKAAEFNLKEMGYPRFYSIFFADWQMVKTREDGLLNISKHVERTAGGPDLVMLRKYFYSAKVQEIEITFGYSDEIAVFHNGSKVFYGDSRYRSRDSGFAGIVGYNDAVYLKLEKGLNEIFLLVKETFGGWGINFKSSIPLAEPEKDHKSLTKLWETDKNFKTPESVVYDKKRDVFYVSNFDVNFSKQPERSQFISKVNLNGEIEKLRWIDSLIAPCGLGIFKDKLYTVERGYLTEIDIEKGEVINRYKIEGSDFLNDLVVSEDGSIYMTDTRPSNHWESRIYKFKDGKSEVWLDTEDVKRANGLTLLDNKLLLGNSGDGTLKSVCLKSKKVEKISSLGAGIIDGIKLDKSNNFIVSHWEGKIFKILDSGGIVELIDTRPEGFNTADFEYIPEKNLLLVPTFLGNSVVAYKIK